MNYNLIKDVLDLVQQYEVENSPAFGMENSVDGFKSWVASQYSSPNLMQEPNWEGKSKGRSPESVISTLIVKMNRYAKSYSKSAIFGSDFSTQEDFIYLIQLKVFGEMYKMDLIKRNVQEKSVGMQTINRLINRKWVEQKSSKLDKRRKIIFITQEGLMALENQMESIRQATQVVAGDLTYQEKMELIRLLKKLNEFHLPIYERNMETEHLLNEVFTQKMNIDSDGA